MRPETKYVNNGDLAIAYQVVGDGPIDIVWFAGLYSHIDLRWDYPPMAGAMERYAAFSRLIVFDRRGSGASDRMPADALPVWEDWSSDVQVVMDEVGSERAALVGSADGGPWAMLFAATHPERVSSLVLFMTAAKWLADETFPVGIPREVVESLFGQLGEHWGTEQGARLTVPSAVNDPDALAWLAKFQRACGSPRAVAAQARHTLEIDCRAILPLIHVPTLVVHRESYPFIPLPLGKHVADNIPGARLHVMPGSDGFMSTGAGVQEAFDAVEEFLTGSRPPVRTNKVLATVLYTDIVGSTEHAARLGDRTWAQVLDRHNGIVREQFARYQGREIVTTGDGFLATFEGPTFAMRCALDTMDALRPLGIEIRAGVHVGECERMGDDLAGLAVVIGARIMAKAGSGELWCSRTVRDLVVGGDFGFDERGVHSLKGVPEDWQLYRVAQS